MRRTSAFAAIVSVLVLLSGCNGRSDDAGIASSADATTPVSQPSGTDTAGAAKTFTGKQRIPVRLTMDARDDGGRNTPFFRGYRPTVRFGDGDSAIETVCAVDTRGRDEFPPGATHVVDLRCAKAVVLHEDALDFVVLDSGREVGAGTVTP